MKRSDGVVRGLARTGEVTTMRRVTLNQIREILHGSEPVPLRMVSGREYRVKHPDYAALGHDDAALVFTDNKGGLELIRLSQLGSVHLDEAPAA